MLRFESHFILHPSSFRDSGRGAEGSTPALGAGGFRFDSEVPDWIGSRRLVA
jgi:hypothetical protein